MKKEEFKFEKKKKYSLTPHTHKQIQNRVTQSQLSCVRLLGSINEGKKQKTNKGKKEREKKYEELNKTNKTHTGE